MKNIPNEDPKNHWSFLEVKDKLVLDMGCSFYEAYFNPGMLSSAEWFVKEGATKVIGFDSDPAEVKKYHIVYKNNPKYEIFKMYLDSDLQIRELLKYKPQVIKCDVEGAEINFNSITKEEMECVEQIAFEYHDVPTRVMCETKLKEWGFDYVEQFSLLDRHPDNQGVYYGWKTKFDKIKNEEPTPPTKTTKKAKVPKVLYIGPGKPELNSIKYYDYEDSSLDVLYVKDDNNLEEIITSFNPDAIITIGKEDDKFPKLFRQTFEVRKKWISLPKIDSGIGQKAYHCAMHQILSLDNSQLISYFTPSYNTGVKLYDTYVSLVNQTYNNWEWVVVDDSNDDGKTLSIAKNIASVDPRVKVYNFEEKSKGNIGESKYRAATLCRGYLLAELDHDDLLTENCTMDLYEASQKYPDAGFFYTDCVEVNQYQQSLTYGEGFACGYGQYYKLNNWDVCKQPNINPKTIRHIVGVPNHVRAWRREVYFAVGGHNRDLTIADDYELVVRTFLKTKFCKIPKLGYIQYIISSGDGHNTHDVSRADIQRRVRTIASHYNEAIKDRFEELGVKDWVYEANIDPISVPSRYGDEEGYVNYIF